MYVASNLPHMKTFGKVHGNFQLPCNETHFKVHGNFHVPCLMMCCERYMEISMYLGIVS